MTMSRYSKRLHITLGVIGLIWVAAAACMFSGVANAAVLTHTAPDPSSSSPINGGHVFFLRKATQAGENKVANIDAYYDQATFSDIGNWNSQYIEIRNGGPLNAGPDARVCNVWDQGMGTAEKNRFITVEIQSEFKLTMDTYQIPYDRVCVEKAGENHTGVDSTNALFAKYPIPSRPSDVNQTTKMYKVSIRIYYNDAAPYGTQANPQGVRFKVVSNPSTKVKIGPTGGQEYAFPIIGAYNPEVNALYTQQLSIPFGMCFGGGPNKAVGVMDSDNFAMPNDQFGDRKVRFRVWDVTDNAWQPFTADDGDNNGIRVAGWYQARDGLASNTTAYFRITMEEGHKYELRVADVAPRNTIVIKLPGNVIAGDEEVCTADWIMQGTSSPTREVKPGDTVTFTHTLKNTGKSTSDLVSSGVYWGPTGQITSGQPSPTGNTARTYAAGASQTWTNSYTIPLNAQNNQQYCQVIKWRPKVKDDPSPATYGVSSPACVTVIKPSDAYVTLEAFVDTGIDTETLTTTQIHGRVEVRGFPSIDNRSTADGQWGYSEISQKVEPTHPPSVWSQEGYVGPPQYMYDYVCPSGWSPASSPTPTTCYGPAPIIGYACPSYAPYSGGSCVQPFTPFPDPIGCGTATRIGNTCYIYSAPSPIYGPQPTQSTSPRLNYSYYCRQTGSYGAWTTSSTDYCADYYVCPAGGGEGWAFSSSGLVCTSWICNYSASPLNTQVYPPANKPNCEYRCPTSGERAWFDKGYADTTGTGDRRCFVQPSFVLTCQWDSGETTTETVNSNGTYCSSATTSRSAGAIGTIVQATLTPLRPTGWLPSNPQPGMIFNRITNSVQQLKTWGWIMIPKTATYNVVGMPYAKVYGGDVRAGGGVGATSQTCSSSSSATIRTYNQGPSGSYAGSGTQFAAYSTGFIDSFVSGQYNDMSANPNVGTAPTRLTFANDAGGNGWGGGFGSGGPCYNYVERLPSDAEHITGSPTTINGRALGIGQKVVQHVKGDVYITNDIKYANGVWGSSAQIPLYQLVVEGNIYIDDDVHQLDGIYAAIPTNGSNGNIYTCAFVQNNSVVVPSQTFLPSATDNCKSQLVVNGAVAARKIFFTRDCGSLVMSYSTESTPSNFQGGSDAQYCGGSNHAAEVFNFSPEVWIRSSTGVGSNKYDSIVSLPPVL